MPTLNPISSGGKAEVIGSGNITFDTTESAIFGWPIALTLDGSAALGAFLLKRRKKA